MNKDILTLVNSLREGTVGKTCMGTGNYSFDIITRREYPNGFVVGKRNKYEEKVLTMEIGNTCGNVMTMLPYLGVKTFPVAKLDVSPQGYQMKRDMKAYGADVRFVWNTRTGGTTILRCMHKLDDQGNPTMAEGPIVFRDDLGNIYDTLRTITSEDEIEKGLAINANLNVGYKTDSWMAKVSVDYIRNDSSWYNSLAQSPSFIAARVMNSDKDGDLTKYGPYAPLYSTFDALYFFTPKHAPVSQYLTNDDAGMENGQTKSYNIAPYSKTSYTTATYTRKELALIDELSDANIQMALPNGLATTNRTGVRANLLAGFGKDNLVEVQGLFTKMDQVAGMGGLDAASYTEFGGGAKIDVLGLLGFSLPLELSGSYKHAERSLSTAEFKTDFINAGLYARYWKRLGISAGFQMINAELNAAGALMQEIAMSNLKVSVAPVMTGKQMQWMVGLDYTLAPHAWLAINYGQATVKNTYSVVGLGGTLLGGEYSASDNSFVPATETNLPDYVAIENRESTASQVEHEFTRSILQATINVEF